MSFEDNVLMQGDCLTLLKTLPDASMQCCVTSPPYWNLRDYGTEDQVGWESTPEAYVARLVEVFREVRRVLRPDGTLWLILGDTYYSRTPHRGTRGTIHGAAPERNPSPAMTPIQVEPKAADGGLKPKGLVGIPWRVALALQADGWYLRSDIIWHKSNAMPESVRDRPAKAHEYLFLLAKSERYYYDAEAIREEREVPAPPSLPRIHTKRGRRHKLEPAPSNPGRNKRSVWTVATRPYPGAHLATFPPALAEPCILAGTSPHACEQCGTPWERVVERQREQDPTVGRRALRGAGHFRQAPGGPAHRDGRTFLRVVASHTVGWQAGCRCAENQGTGRCVVLDPFGGSGTTAAEAKRLGRDYVLIELNPAYVELAQQRVSAVQPILIHAA